MAVQLSPGKWQRLRSLTDEQGRFKMLAVDQRDSLRRAMANAIGLTPQQITPADLMKAKAVITAALAPYATAVLTDPVYGYPPSIQYLPSRVGLLLSAEETGYEKAGPSGRERKSHLMEGWSAEQALHMGADAVKLLVYYHPDASGDVCAYQQAVVRGVGEGCEQAGLPFLLELVTYPLDEPGADTAGFARRKPDLVIRSAAEFSRPDYKVDILKLEFPADLKWAREFCAGAFDGQERQAVYTLRGVRESCLELDEAAGVPWVILSAGVDIQEFLIQAELATEAGASGFLCGRAIWKDAVPLYPDIVGMESWLSTRGAHNFVRANACVHRARPWSGHRRFGQAQEGPWTSPRQKQMVGALPGS